MLSYLLENVDKLILTLKTFLAISYFHTSSLRCNLCTSIYALLNLLLKITVLGHCLKYGSCYGC